MAGSTRQRAERKARARNIGLTYGHRPQARSPRNKICVKEGRRYRVNQTFLQGLRNSLLQALNPAYANPVRELKDMSEEEKRKIEERYAAKIVKTIAALLILPLLLSGCLAPSSGFVQGLSNYGMSPYQSQRLELERERNYWQMLDTIGVFKR